MAKDKSKIKSIALRYTLNILFILVGTFLMGISFSVFLSPNKISPTGFSGIASIICNLLAKSNIIISPSIIYLALNAVLFIIAFKSMGKEFIILSITGVGGFSLSMFVCEYIKIDVGNDLLLCALYGGLLMGLGSGLVLKSGGSTGGCDTIACMLKHHNAKITTGQLIMTIDGIIIVASCFIYGINYGMYALITTFIMGNVCDVVLNGVKAARAYYIITDKGEELSEAIKKNVNRGVTQINATGMYKKQSHNMLFCLVTRSQVIALKRTIKEIDPNAFMYSVNVTEAIGMGFEPLEKDKNEKKKDKKKKTIKANEVIEQTAEVTNNTETVNNNNVSENNETVSNNSN